MSPQSRVRLEIFVDPASDPISGSVVRADGGRHAFTGWIELTAALEDARTTDSRDVIAHKRGAQSSFTTDPEAD